jgi:topoisomerase IA-like protein
MSKQSFLLVVTAAFVLNGEIVRPGDFVEVTKAEATNLLGRGRARIPTEAELEEAGVREAQSAAAAASADAAEAKPAKAEKPAKAAAKPEASKAG